MITNKLKLPEAIVNAVKQVQSEYSGKNSYISASGITTPPRIFHLKKRYRKEITEDVSDLIWSLVGTLMHSTLQRGGEQEEHAVIEERLFKEVLGVKFSGQLDHFAIKDKTLTDWKFASLWSVVNGPSPEYVAQANCLRLLLHEAGYEVDKLQLCYIIRDWTKSKAKYDKSYPQHQVKIVELPVWTLEETEAFILNKIQLLLDHEKTPDDELPECSKEDRWNDGDVWAVMQKGKKRAVKLHSDELEARIHLGKVENGYIEHREGSDKRCLDFCNVNFKCNYYKEKYGERK